MRKLLSVAAICLICALALFGCTKHTVGADANASYEIDVKVEGNELVCSQKTTVVNTYREGLDSLTFMLYANAYAEGAVSHAYSTKLSSYGGIEVTSLTVNGAETEFTLGEDSQSMSFAVPAMPLKETAEISFEYTVVLPECDLRLGLYEGYYNLSNFYPQLAVYDGEDFRSDLFCTVGDPVYSGLADFKVNVDMDEGLVAACSGMVSDEKVSDGRKSFTVSGENMRDFAMVLNESYEVAVGEWEGITVRYYHVGDGAASERVALALNAIKTFSETFGDYPYEVYTLAVTPFEADGMEFSGLVYIASDASDVEETIIHETAHQWWYNLVGNDNVNASWIDEGLATFTSAYYYQLNGDESAFKARLSTVETAYLRYETLQKARTNGGVVSMTKPIYDYTDYQYTMLVYYKSCLLFKNLYETAGQDKFNAALKTFVADNRFKTVGAEELTAAFSDAMRCDMAGLINGWLSDSAILATFAA